MAACQSHILESELPELQQKAVDLLDKIQENLPDKTGEKGKLRRLTAFYRRSVRLCCGATQ